MSIASLAHGARQSLARGLEALQAVDAPPGLMDVAQPVARAMGVLVELERAPDGAPAAGVRPVLEALREGLRLLQLPEHVEHPAAARGMAAVAETLGTVVEIALSLRGREPLDLTPAWPGTAPVQPVLPAPVKSPPKAEPAAAAAAIPASSPAPRRPPVTQTLAPAAPKVEPRVIVLPAEPAQRAPEAAPAPPPVAPAMRAPEAAPAPPPVAPAMSATRANPAPAQPEPPVITHPVAISPAPALASVRSLPPLPSALGQANAAAQTNALLRREVIIERGLRAIDAALGAHSASNFYTGLGGGDIVAAGGLFVATYQVPKVGEKVLLDISMPGGYQFVAKAIVAWTRGGAHSAASLESLRAPAGAPGFGAQFCEITDEGRRLVQRYVRNREPLFYDDL